MRVISKSGLRTARVCLHFWTSATYCVDSCVIDVSAKNGSKRCERKFVLSFIRERPGNIVTL